MALLHEEAHSSCLPAVRLPTSCLQACGLAAAAGLNTSTYAEAIAAAYAVGGASAQVCLLGACWKSENGVRFLSPCRSTLSLNLVAQHVAISYNCSL